MAGPDFSVRDLVRGLETATTEVKRAVADLVQVAALLVESQTRAAYPLGKTGILRQRIVAKAGSKRAPDASGVQLTWYARAFAPHVHMIESGTRDRRDPTRGNAFRGHVQARGPIFIPIAAHQRARMLAQAAAFVDRPKELV